MVGEELQISLLNGKYIVTKGENASCPALSPFLTVVHGVFFSYLGWLKGEIM